MTWPNRLGDAVVDAGADGASAWADIPYSGIGILVGSRTGWGHEHRFVIQWDVRYFLSSGAKADLAGGPSRARTGNSAYGRMAGTACSICNRMVDERADPREWICDGATSSR